MSLPRSTETQLRSPGLKATFRRTSSRSLRRAAAVTCAIILFAFGYPAFAKSDTVPDWVRAAAAQPLPAYPPETKSVVLLDDVTYTVATDGRAVEHVRSVVKILRPQGRPEATIRVGFDDDTKILSMNVWSIGPDGHEYAMKDKEFSDTGYGESFVAFADDRFRVAHAPGGDPGGVIAYEYEQRSRPFVTEKTWYFQGDTPRLNQTFTLELPAGYTYGTVWAHHQSAPASDLENGHWRWAMKDTPAIDLDRIPMPPADSALAGRMTVHYAGSGIGLSTDGTWRSIGEWYSQLSKDRLTATPEIAAKAQELTAGKTGFYDKAEAIGEFVQKDVRYVAVEVGIGGYQPHAAADVFRNRYGDCKDKATLTSAMLSAVGIHAALLMVDTDRGSIDAAAPSLFGDHMIAAIEIPVGYSAPGLHSIVTAKTGRRYLIFDPTWEKTPFGQLEHDLQGSYGVLMEGADSQAIELPVLDPTLNTVYRNAAFQLTSDGALKGTVTEKRFGDLADDRREMYTSGDEKEQREYLDHVLENDFTAFTASDVKAENVSSLNKDFTLTYAITADRYAKSTGPLLMVRPRVLGDIGLANFDRDVEPKVRTVPIDLGETMQLADDYTIELPPGYVVDELPDPVKMDLGFAAYQSAVEVIGNTMRYKRTYTVRQVTLPANRYSDVRKLADAIASDQESRAVLKKQ
jgi:hypothetical protein